MNARLQPSYTNDISPEYLRSLDKPHFTEQRIAQFSEQARAVVCEQQAYIDTHPAIAIFRCATEGSHTRNGGVIQQGTGPLEFNLEDGRAVRAARKGDYVLYADGSTAQIITGAGQGNNDVALVGSVLSNGDEIINTLQDGFLFIAREGVSTAEDFLPSIAD
jgi:anti-sigma factor RsiW